MTPEETPEERKRALLLWDGGCGLCARWAGWVAARDGAGRIETLPFQEAPSPPMTEALRARCEGAVQIILPGGEVRSGGRAVLGVLGLLGWRKTAALLGRPPLVWAVEAGYRLVAANRGRLGGLAPHEGRPTRSGEPPRRNQSPAPGRPRRSSPRTPKSG